MTNNHLKKLLILQGKLCGMILHAMYKPNGCKFYTITIIARAWHAHAVSLLYFSMSHRATVEIDPLTSWNLKSYTRLTLYILKLILLQKGDMLLQQKLIPEKHPVNYQESQIV